MRGFALLALLLLIPLAPTAAAFPLTCTPGNFACVGQDEYFWHSDEDCTDPNSYYHWTDRVAVAFLVGVVLVSSQRECRNQLEDYGQQYEEHWWSVHAGVIVVGAVTLDWRERHEQGTTTCSMDARVILVDLSPGCVLGPPPEGPITP